MSRALFYRCLRSEDLPGRCLPGFFPRAALRSAQLRLRLFASDAMPRGIGHQYPAVAVFKSNFETCNKSRWIRGNTCMPGFSNESQHVGPGLENRRELVEFLPDM